MHKKQLSINRFTSCFFLPILMLSMTFAFSCKENSQIGKNKTEFKPTELIVRKGAKSYTGFKEGKEVKRHFLGGEIVSAMQEIEYLDKKYYNCYEEYISYEDAIPLEDLLRNIKEENHKPGKMTESEKKPNDFLTNIVDYDFVDKNMKYFNKVIKSIEKGECIIPNNNNSDKKICFRALIHNKIDLKDGILVNRSFSEKSTSGQSEFRSSFIGNNCIENYFKDNSFHYFRNYSEFKNQKGIFSKYPEFEKDITIWKKISEFQKPLGCNDSMIQTPIKASFLINLEVIKSNFEMCGEDCTKVRELEVHENILDIDYKGIEFIEEELDGNIYFRLKDNFTFDDKKGKEIFCKGYGGRLPTDEDREKYLSEMSTENTESLFDEKKSMCIKSKE